MQLRHAAPVLIAGILASSALAAGRSNTPTPGIDELGRRAPAAAPASTSTPAKSRGDAGGSAGEGGIAGAIPNWSALGPFGGDVSDVAVSPLDPNLMIAGVAPSSGGGALFRSANAGATWSAVSAFANVSVYDIEFAPDGTVYATTIDSVRKSTNGGVTWTPPLNLGIGLNDQVFDLAIDPNNPSILWIGVADAIGTQAVNIMQSVNGGTSWQNRTPPLASPMSGRAIAINPNNSLEIYAGFGGGFGGGQLWVSTTGGASWVNRSAGLPNTPVNSIVHTGALALVGGGQLFGSQNFGLFSTNNLGVTWTPIHDGTWPSLVINDIAVDPNNPNTRYAVTPNAGVFRSVNGGPWQFGVGGTGGLSLVSVRFAPASSSRIVVGANSTGVLQSNDSGATFDITSAGISMLNIRGSASNPNNDDELAVAFEGLNNGGVYTSLNAGQTWSLEPVPPTRYSNVAFAPDGTLYAISSGPSSIAPEGVYRRNANGTWSGLGPDQGTLFESDLTAVRFSSGNPLLMLAVGADFGVAGSQATIWRTPDGGVQWTKVYEGPQNFEFVNDLEIVAGTSDQTMIACFADFSGSPGSGGGALRSTTGGTSWVPANTGLPAAVQGSALSATANPNTFLLADGRFTGGGLFRTTDAGLSWSPTGFLGFVVDVVVDPADASAVYILIGSPPSVQKSVDGGTVFSPFTAGLVFTGGVNRLTYVPASPPRLMLATSSAGTFVTDLAEAPATCAADLFPPGAGNGDGTVGPADLAQLLSKWGPCPAQGACSADLFPVGNPGGDGTVGPGDLGELLSQWGQCG